LVYDINTSVVELSVVDWKKSFLSPTLDRTQLLEVFIYWNVASWGMPQGVPRFVNGGPNILYSEYHTHARRRSAGLELGDILIF
jgi:hypothetical protein